MIKRRLPYLGVLLIGLGLVWVLPTVNADDLGKMRVQRMNGSWLVGDVEELADAYRIKTGNGITVTLKRARLRRFCPTPR